MWVGTTGASWRYTRLKCVSTRAATSLSHRVQGYGVFSLRRGGYYTPLGIWNTSKRLFATTESAAAVTQMQQDYAKLLHTYKRANDLQNAVSLFGKMKQEGVALNRAVYNDLIALYTKNGDTQNAAALFAEMKNGGITPDIMTYSHLINMYGRLKDTKNALTLYYEMRAQGINRTPHDAVCFHKLHIIGLGYKAFVQQGRLYVNVGDANFYAFDIPPHLKVLVRKKKMYFFGWDKEKLKNFVENVKTLKRINYFKGKGIIEFKDFSAIRLKKGKKQRKMK